MIPSLNLNKLKAAAAAAHSPTPRSAGDTGASYSERSGVGGGDLAGGHEVSAIRSGAIDAGLFLGLDLDTVSDVHVLRSKLKEAKGLLVALDAWYAARLAEKDQLMAYRLGQLTMALEGGSPKVKPRTVATARERPGSSPGNTTPRRYAADTTVSTQHRTNSPRLEVGSERRTRSPVAGRAPSESGSTAYRRSVTPVGSSASSVMHPRPFGANPGRRASTATMGGSTPYVPATGVSPRLPWGSFAARVPSTPVTPVGTPRTGRLGSSPMDAVGIGISPRHTLTTPLSARSAGGAPASARRSQVQMVNWSSSIPHSEATAPSSSSGAGPIHRSMALSNNASTTSARSIHVAPAPVCSVAPERRAYTPR